jgi:ankyrin repeat protein
LQDYDGRTPLHIAGSNGYKKLFNILVAAGADTKIKDNFGNLPKLNDKDLSKEENNISITEITKTSVRIT